MDKAMLARDQPGDCTPVLEGQSAMKVLWSAISVEVGMKISVSAKAQVTDTLESTETPENGHEGIRTSPPKKVVGSIAPLKCIHTNACGTGNKQEELEATGQQENCGLVEAWWDDLHNWDAAMDSCKIFRRDKQGRKIGKVALNFRSVMIVQNLMMVLIELSVYG
ncbi:hypothetical protein DUI87_08128 [Hirundo rustica rustica]|uniref:Uncharacterized protein n=1 Tax=Hirundo rustica rustica TaxID=333673 RepID=A0A3M0KRK6_HIRRU|nr:hypothetical protein DUI87_08128 [Hirundo rustica rustica]